MIIGIMQISPSGRIRNLVLCGACLMIFSACELFFHKPDFNGDAESDAVDVTGDDVLPVDDGGDVEAEAPEDPALDPAGDELDGPEPDGPADVTSDDAGPDEAEIVELSCEGLVLLMHFDMRSDAGETSTRVVDFSGSGNHGTVTGAAFDGTAGRFEGCYVFDGDGDAVVVNDSESLDFTDVITLSAWVYPTAYTSFNYVLTKGSDPHGYPYLHYGMGYYSDTGEFRFVVSSETQYQLIHSDLELNQWHHVVGTFDLARPGNNMRLYINGDMVQALAVPEAIVTNDKNVLIGGYEYDVLETWIGRIDDLALFNRALSGAEVRWLYESDAPMDCDTLP
jgi:hypothetical protein